MVIFSNGWLTIHITSALRLINSEGGKIIMFKKANLEIYEINIEDVITTSTGLGDITGGEEEDP